MVSQALNKVNVKGLTTQSNTRYLRMSNGYSFTTTQGVCEMKKTKLGYLLLCLISVVLLAACQASYVRDVSGGSVSNGQSVLSGNTTAVK